MVEAVGKKDNKKLTVKYQDGQFLWNGESDEIYTLEMEILINNKLPVYGTYVPDDIDDLYVAGILKEYFFDDSDGVDFKDEIIGDWEEGVVY